MTSEKLKFSKRLNDVLDELGLPKAGQGRHKSLAKLLDVPSDQIRQWLTGEGFPQTSKLVKLAKYLNVRSNWLLSGIGEKHAEDKAEGVETITAIALPKRGAATLAEPAATSTLVSEMHSMLSKDAFELALAWMKLPLSQRRAINKVVEELARNR